MSRFSKLCLCCTAVAVMLSFRTADAVLVAHYTFDETAGQTANDTAGTPQNLERTNGGVAWTDGIIGGAVNLTADVMYANSALADGEDFTMMAWINEASGQGGYRGIFTTGATAIDAPGDINDGIPGGGTDNWGLNIEGASATRNGDLRVNNTADGSSNGLNTPGTVSQGAWHHLALTYTGDGTNATAIAYLNGVEVASVTDGGTERDFTAGSQVWQLGTDRNNDGRRFTGLVDDLGIWNEVLSASEIQRIYNNGLAGAPLTEPGTIVPGDVTGEGDVNSLDFEVIRKNFLKNLDARTDGDLIDNGVVDFADYAQWKNVSPKDPNPLSGASAVGVPEPSSMLMLAAGALALGVLRRVQ